MKARSIVKFVMITLLFLPFSQLLSQPGGRNFRGHEPHMYMIEKLNLSDSQKKQIDEFRNSHQKEMIDLKASLEKLRIETRELKTKGNINRKDFIAQVEKMNKIRNQMALSRADMQMDFYETLTPEQKKEWETCDKGMMHRPERMERKMRMYRMD